MTEMISDIVGYAGVIKFDDSMPDGQPRRVLDVSRMRKELGSFSPLSLKEGLIRTIKWYNDGQL